MSLIAKMFVEDKEITILDFKFRFTRAVNEHGFPMGRVNGTIFEIIFETTADQSFMSWAISTDMRKNVKIVVSPVDGMSKSRTIELYDVYCVHFKNDFHAETGEPMTTLIHLTPAIMIDDGYKVLDHYWKTTDLSAIAPVTTLEPEKEPILIDTYYVDEKDNRINKEKLKIGQQIYLVVESENGIGKKVSISLRDNSRDFEYQGKRLEDDILRDVGITANKQKFSIKIIDQKN